MSVAGPLTVDATPPKIQGSKVKEASGRETTPVIEVTAIDNESGIKAYRIGPKWIDLPGGTSELIRTPVESPLFLQTIRIWVKNGAGLTSSKRVEVSQ